MSAPGSTCLGAKTVVLLAHLTKDRWLKQEACKPAGVGIASLCPMPLPICIVQRPTTTALASVMRVVEVPGRSCNFWKDESEESAAGDLCTILLVGRQWRIASTSAQIQTSCQGASSRAAQKQGTLCNWPSSSFCTKYPVTEGLFKRLAR